MKYKLEDICLKITDGSHYSPADDVTSDIPMLSVKDMEEFDFNYNNCKHISEEEYDKMLRNDCVPKLYDVLVAKDGSYLKEIFVNEEENKKAILSSIAIFRPNQEIVDPYFLCYLLKTPMILNYVKDNCVSGSALPRIILRAFKGIELTIPELEIQRKIVKIIKSINSKIRINNEINNNLHELINQNYSNYLNELDEYIELDIKDIFDFETGVEPGSKNYLEKPEDNSIKFYRVGDMNSECNTFIKEELSNGKLIDEKDVVVSFDATIGRIGYGLKGAYSTGMKKISINSKYKNIIDNSLVYAYFNNKAIQNIMMENARGTTILHASSSIDFMNFKYNESLLKKYSKLISVAFDKMKSIKNENEKLSKLRDTLLPKLMNGEIDLDNIEI